MAVQIEKPRRPINVVLRSFARQSVQAMEQGFRTQHVWPYEIYPGFAKINAIRKARAMRGGKDWFATGEGLKSFQYEVMSAAQGNETIRIEFNHYLRSLTWVLPVVSLSRRWTVRVRLITAVAMSRYGAQGMVTHIDHSL